MICDSSKYCFNIYMYLLFQKGKDIIFKYFQIHITEDISKVFLFVTFSSVVLFWNHC